MRVVSAGIVIVNLGGEHGQPQTTSALIHPLIVRPIVPQNFGVPKGKPRVSANFDPDEDVLLEFGMFRRRLEAFVDADGRRDPQEVALIQLFDDPFDIAKHRYGVRRSFESLMRNGLTKKTKDGARHAGLAIVIDDGTKRVSNVIALFPDAIDPEAA